MECIIRIEDPMASQTETCKAKPNPTPFISNQPLIYFPPKYNLDVFMYQGYSQYNNNNNNMKQMFVAYK